ncbi:hypothetical protein HHK36_028669 [Tetracentron sinense]|uniref:Poly(A) RNA polymerase mitochondrial-like central palm domain-containing protein n=1 Tax=Tetracentron sinense TaxID=13715 RepID=A0A835D0F8_TETSI|nr:hypothetical protein HHK36_028669 [Tetracentron sinense]
MNSSMDSYQLVDSLTAHISFYHSATPSTSQSPSANRRASILRWFASLTVHQRQSYLTIIDAKFTGILLQMQNKLRKHGHGFFIILPDIPSCEHPSLPSLCFRKSRGLLARAGVSNELERSISGAVRMFGSREGERIEECSCSVSVIDSITVSEEFVGDLDRFISVMDGVSNGGFLRGEESDLGSAWEELPWLKAKGYYSMEAFVANKLELALRLSWLNCNGSKKRGAKLKEKASVAGVAANFYWRKKGCLDWWGGLDPGVRKKIFKTVLCKSTRSLTNEIVKGANSALENEMWLFSEGAEQPLRYSSTLSCQRTIPALSAADAEFGLAIIPASVSGKPPSLANVFNGLLVLQDISAMILACLHSEYEKEKLFFSTLYSVHTISDGILRKLRGLLMVVSLDCTKLELLGEGNLNSPLNKSKEKLAVGNRRGKGKSRNMKRLNPVPRSAGADFSLEKPLEEHGCGLDYRDNADCVETNGMTLTLQDKVFHREASLSGVEMEHGKGLVDEKVQTVGKKSRKESIKSKKSSLKEPVAIENYEVRIVQSASPSVTFQHEAAKSNQSADASTVQNLKNDISIGSDIPMPKSAFFSSANEPNTEDNIKVSQNIQENSVVGLHECSSPIGLDCFDSNRAVGNHNSNTSSRKETSDYAIEGLDHVLSNEELSHQFSEHLSHSVSTSVVSQKSNEAIDLKEETPPIQKQESVNSHAHAPMSSSGCTSYEWPSVGPVNLSTVNSHHLPAATDRLHLDVGRNWRNHFHQAFVPTTHQARNPSIEGGCSRILSRTLPMSLDWPPMVRSASRLTPSMAYNYDSGFIPRLQSSYRQGFTAHGLKLNGTTTEDERKYSGDVMEMCDLTNAPEIADECESHWLSGEEFEVHAFSGSDYNQYFGGGVMYWNTSDHPGTGFSRPPSLSSEDSSWAWHEADLNRSIDDMVGLSSSYSTNGLTSPPAAPFCSPFDPLGPGHQALSYVMPGNDVTSKVLHSSSTVTDGVPEEIVSGSLANSSAGVVEAQNGDSFPYPILRPIIIPSMSRRGSRSEFKHSHDRRSPCVPPTRREQPQIKRPPSPVVLCVPRAPHPPPPSPVGESRKHKGFPTVRSGSSSPRHWGMRSWYHDGTNCEEARLCVDGAEVIWPLWRNKGLSATPMIQPLPGALLQDRLIAISQLSLDQEHPDVAFPLQPLELLNCPARKTSLSLLHSFLHDEIDSFCKQMTDGSYLIVESKVAADNFIRKPYINWAVKRVTRSLQVLWPRSRTNIFGSNATGLSLPTSDVDLVVCLPPVRNLEPIKEAGILEGRNGIKETCLQHAARYLANQEWVQNDSLKAVENTAIPIIMLVAEVPRDLIVATGNASNVQIPKEESTQRTGEQGNIIHYDMVGSENSSLPKCSQMKVDNGMDVKSVRLDISFKSPSHTGLQTTELVKELTEQFPAATPLALVLKQFLADRSLDQSYSGGLSSYCLVLLITRFLQHEHHLGRPIKQVKVLSDKMTKNFIAQPS